MHFQFYKGYQLHYRYFHSLTIPNFFYSYFFFVFSQHAGSRPSERELHPQSVPGEGRKAGRAAHSRPAGQHVARLQRDARSVRRDSEPAGDARRHAGPVRHPWSAGGADRRHCAGLERPGSAGHMGHSFWFSSGRRLLCSLTGQYKYEFSNRKRNILLVSVLSRYLSVTVHWRKRYWVFSRAL